MEKSISKEISQKIRNINFYENKKMILTHSQFNKSISNNSEIVLLTRVAKC
jgi:hypothetical protein